MQDLDKPSHIIQATLLGSVFSDETTHPKVRHLYPKPMILLPPCGTWHSSNKVLLAGVYSLGCSGDEEHELEQNQTRRTQLLSL